MVKKFDRENDLVLTREQSRNFDTWAINEMGVAGVVLMENAGRGCAEVIIGELEQLPGRKVCIFCGTGNNGGDGFVIARHLANGGFDAKIGLCGPGSKTKGDAEINYKIACRMGILIEEFDVSSADIEKTVRTFAGSSSLIVDAIFGTGLAGSPGGGFDKFINAINSLNKPIIAVDIPSGLDCDTGSADGAAIRAMITVTFAAAKKGFLNPASAEYTGEVYIASIGIKPRAT